MFNKSAKIPAEMIDLPQWVLWQFVQRKAKPDKPDKPLFDAKTRPLRLASVTNPATWSTYEQAVSRVNDKTGLGFILTPPYIGLDLDHCIQNGVLDVRAREILAAFPNTYAERSPSAYVHLIMKGEYPPEMGHKFGHKETGSLEMYTRGRYFTVTGNTIAGAPSQIQYVSKEELQWVASKFIPKTAGRNGTGREVVHAGREADYGDGTPIGKGSPVFDMLCATNLNWESTWNRTRRPEGAKGDQSDSAVDMSLARMARQADLDRGHIYSLLVGWRREHRLPIKHHALVLTIETAHKEFAETEQDKLLNDPATLESPRATLAAHIEKHLGLAVARFVQMGRDDARYRVHLTNGHVRDMGTYAVVKTFVPWEKLAAEQMLKRLVIEKKRWVKIFNMLFAMVEVEESDETGGAAETRAWLDNYIGDVMYHPATYDTLKHSSPFVDETGSYLQLDAFHSYAAIHYGARGVLRGAMAGRLKVLGWEPVKLTRADEKHTITRNYWHKAP